MKNKLILLISLFLSLVGQCLYADIEKTMTIYMNNGTEKELRIPVPSEMASRADEYAKAYTIIYMKWWNAGVQFNLPYMFDSSHFRDNTPPKRITAFAGDHAEYVFSMTGLIDKVQQEASDYLDNQTYIDNPPAKEVTVLLGTYGVGAPEKYAKGSLKVEVPERFQKRAVEYGEAYAQAYEGTWNSLLYTEDRFRPYGLDIRFRGDRHMTNTYKIGADIKAYIKKLFEGEEHRGKVIKHLEEKVKVEAVEQAERYKRWSENDKNFWTK